MMAGTCRSGSAVRSTYGDPGTRSARHILVPSALERYGIGYDEPP